MQELFRGVDWRATAILNSLRAIFAGVVWGIFMIFYGKDLNSGLIMLFGFVIAYWIFVFPAGYLSAKLSQLGVPMTGLFSMAMSFLVAVGDPFLFVLSKFIGPLKALVPQDYSPFNLVPIALVNRDDVISVDIL